MIIRATVPVDGGDAEGSLTRAATTRAWLGGSRLGLVIISVLVGVGAGLAAAGFRWLIFGVTWLVTGHQQFGQQGHAASLHLPFLGVWVVLLAPVAGGLVYGPFIQRFAREARGHGVPEVMLAVAENGGRIRPQVSIVKALASAVCIGTGGSVGREGPIVQIGSAFASTVGQFVRMSQTRLRVIVACGAAGGIAATFNAPITGVFFGFEIVLREFSLDALFATILAAATGDLVSRAFFGSAPFFAGIPHGLFVTNDTTYLLIVMLGLCAGLIGVVFKTVLYRLEDLGDELWAGKPEWARPAVGGLLLGVLLLAIPQMFGVGYPVMDRAIAGHVIVTLLILFLAAKILATSVTLAIGGSGGVFAPSLFAGAMGGEAFGVAARHLFGVAIGPPALYAVVAMGAVFAATAQAPLTAIASVAEMTGNFGLTVPIMLGCGIAAALSKQISYGSIYTTKLLRRGIDIERPKPSEALQRLTVSDVMHPFTADRQSLLSTNGDRSVPPEIWERLVGPVADTTTPQALFDDETLNEALRQLVLHGHAGLPVLSHDGRLRGWLTRHAVLATVADALRSASEEIERGARAADFATPDPDAAAHTPSTPLEGYAIIELGIPADSPAHGRSVSQIAWPPGSLAVATTRGRQIIALEPHSTLHAGERLIVLTPTAATNPTTSSS